MAQVVINTVITASYLSLIAVSFAVFYRLNRFFHIAHGALLVIGAYTAYICIRFFAWPLWLATIAGTLAAGAVALCFDILLFRVLRQRRSSDLVMLLMSLGLFILLEAIVSLTCGADTKVIPSPGGTFTLGEARVTWIGAVAVVSNVIWVTCVFWLLHRTRFGMQYLAASSDDELSQIYGVKLSHLHRWVALLTGSMAGFGGVLWGTDLDLTPTMGFKAILFGAVAAVIGGGTVIRTFLTSFALAAVLHATILYWSAHWQDVSLFMILLLALLLNPKGFLGKSTRLAQT